MTTTHGGWRWGLVAVGALAAAAVAAKDLPALPQDLALARTGDSPGQVTFRHASHVDAEKASCLSCHPKLFSVLGRSREKPAPAVTHARMEKGETCGACHGKGAFGFDDCTACHAQ